MNIVKVIQILICVIGLTGCGGSGGSSNTGGNNNPIAYNISGAITANGIGLFGVTFSENIGSGSRTTDSSGAYSFSAVPNGTYNITPSKAGYTFSPASLIASVNGSDVTGKNFTASATVVPPNTYNISGTITANGIGLSGVTFAVNSGSNSPTTDNSGAYSFSAVPNGTYNITPSKAGYTFSPTFLTVPVNGANATGQNFTALATVVLPNTYNITGAITANGIALSGASITLSGTVFSSTTTDNSGAYAFSAVPNGTYNITPSKTGYTFSPTFLMVPVSSANASGQNFTASTNTTTCSDRIPVEVPSYGHTERTNYPSPPDGYVAILGWVNVIIGKSEYGMTGKAIIEKLELWEKEGTTERFIGSNIICTRTTTPNVCWNAEDQVWGYLWPKSKWIQDTSWWAPNNGTSFSISPEGYVEANAGNNPDMIYHFWNTYDPRPLAKSTATYFVKAQVKIEGNAMVQIGLDYYTQQQGGVNKEAAYSNWYCSSVSGWQAIKAGNY